MKISPVKKDKALSKRLAGYSTTAGAAMLCAAGVEFAMPVDAHAAIQNITSITASDIVNFHSATVNPIFGAGPFNLHFSAANNGGYNFGFARFTGGAQIAKSGTTHGQDMAKNLAFGDFLQAQVFAATGMIGGVGSSGAFGHIVAVGADAFASGYIAFKQHLGTHDTFGWLKVKLTNDATGHPTELSFVQTGGVYGAYGDNTDDLKAGQVAPAPEPSTLALEGLALLAMGALGVREMRRRRAA